MSAVVTPSPLTPAPQAEWFLARDGQQFGPLSDPELRKLIDLGHLKPTDLLWREGFPEWRSAHILLPETGAPKPALAAVAPAAAAATQASVAVASASNVSTVTTPAPAAAAAPVAAQPVAAYQAPAQVARVAAPQSTHPAIQVQAPAQAFVQAPAAAEGMAPGPVNSGPVNSGPVNSRPVDPPSPSFAQRAAAAAQAAMTLSPAPPNAMAAGGQPAQPTATVPMRQASAPASQMPAPQHMRAPQQAAPQAPAPAPPRAAAPPMSPMPPMQAQPMQPTPGPAISPHSAPVATARNVELTRPEGRPDAARPAPRLGPAPQRGRSAAPIVGRDFEDEERDVARGGIGRWIARIAIVVFFAATLSAAGLYAYPHRDSIVAFAKGLVPASIATPSAKSPLIGFAPTPEATDAALQGAPLWQVLKREFPEWYTERVREASALAREQKPDAQIADAMMAQIMALRRKHAGDALSATSAKLKGIAVALTENLVRLRSTSVEACHGFITSGETHPAYLKLLGDPAHTAALQVQLASVFEGVAEGRKVPRVYPQPKQVDYNTVVSLLEKRGWSNADMRLFSDSGSFAKAEPEKMCRMVIDWFQAQLEITDSESQIRLLSDALKPVIAG